MVAFERQGAVRWIGGLLPVLLFCLFLMPFAETAKAAAGETDSVLISAESLFKAMKQTNYAEIWMGLTQKSRKIIAEDVFKKTKGAGQTGYSVDAVEKDFDGNGPVAKEYWDAFLQSFNPDEVLERSTWEIGFVKKDTAEICLLHKNAENPARLKMFKENGQWKVGLVETFWNRK